MDENNLYHRLMFDAQTSGGLVFTMDEAYVGELGRILKQLDGEAELYEIGRVLPRGPELGAAKLFFA